MSPDKGVFAIDMIDLTRSEQTYLRNSAIIETRLYDSHGGACASSTSHRGFAAAGVCFGR